MGRFMLLGIAIGLLALVIGYMVGASSTPVAGVALPLVFGLVVSAVGLLQRQNALEQLKALVPQLKDTKDASATQTLQKQVAIIEDDVKNAPRLVGLGLIIFVLLYGLGLWLGAYVRNSGILAVAITPPWIESELEEQLDNDPLTADMGLSWISLSQKLRLAGVSNEVIQELYQVAWTQGKEVLEAAKATPPAQTGRDTEPVADSGDNNNMCGGVPCEQVILPSLQAPLQILIPEDRVLENIQDLLETDFLGF